MGTKNVVDRESVAIAVAQTKIASIKMAEASAEIASVVKAMQEDPEVLSGDRADKYKETIDTLLAFAKETQENASKLSNQCTEISSKLNLELDKGSKDTTVAQAKEKVNAARKKQLSGN